MNQYTFNDCKRAGYENIMSGYDQLLAYMNYRNMQEETK